MVRLQVTESRLTQLSRFRVSLSCNGPGSLTPWLLRRRNPSHAPAVTMDVAVAVSGYVSKIAALGDGAAGSSAKMKILLLDSETVSLQTNGNVWLR